MLRERQLSYLKSCNRKVKAGLSKMMDTYASKAEQSALLAYPMMNLGLFADGLFVTQVMNCVCRLVENLTYTQVV